jgi:hypothetical protein
VVLVSLVIGLCSSSPFVYCNLFFLPNGPPRLFCFYFIPLFSLYFPVFGVRFMAESSSSFWTFDRNSVHRLLFTLAYSTCRELVKSVGKL